MGEELAELQDLGDLLTTSQRDELNELLAEIRTAWDNQVVWRTWTEANYSVLNDIAFPTPASKYHQACREQLVFYENLVALGFEFRRAQVNLRKKMASIEKEPDPDEKELLEVDRDELLWQIESMKLQAKDRLRELKMWSEIKSRVDDGSFDTLNKDTDELVGLTVRYCREALLIDPRKAQDVGAVANIMGQAITCLVECQKRGIQLPPECNKALRKIEGQNKLKR